MSTSLKSLLQNAASQNSQVPLSTDDVETTTETETSTTVETSTTTSELSSVDEESDKFGAEQEPNSFVHEMMIQSARRLPNDDFELPDFEICPILPDLPGESGSIRKVRDTERAKVNRRIDGKHFFHFRKSKKIQ